METAKHIETMVIPHEKKALSEYQITPAEVALKVQEYLSLKVLPDDGKSYRVARAALTTCVTTRTSVDKRRKELGEDARKWVAAVNQTARDLVAPLAPAEAHLRNELDTEDKRKDEIKAEKARLEKKRIDDIFDRISSMRQIVLQIPGKSVQELEGFIQVLTSEEVTAEIYQEFIETAKKVQAEIFDTVAKAIDIRRQLDLEEAARKIEAERLEKQRKEQEAEAARLKAEREAYEAKRKKEEERVFAERKKIEEEKATLEREKKASDERRWRSRLEQLKGAGWNGQEAFDQETDKPIISHGDLVAISESKFSKVVKEWNKIVADREAAKAETDRIAAEQKVEVERKQREEFERKAKEKAEAEAKAKVEREEKKKKEREEREAAAKARREAMAPDREKLLNWVDRFDLSIPQLSSVEAKQVYDNARQSIETILRSVIERTKAL